MKKLLFTLIFAFLVPFGLVRAQNQTNMYYRGDMNSWGSTSMTYSSFNYTWQVVIQSDGDEDPSEFKLANTTDWSDKEWSSQTSMNFTTIYTASYHQKDDGGSVSNGSFSETNTKYYNFSIYDVASGNTKMLVQELSGAPNDISSVTDLSSGTVYQDQTPEVDITLSGNKVSEEKIYIIYSTHSDFSSYSSVLATGTGTSYSGVLPYFEVGTTVYYYVITTTLTPAQWSSDIHLATIKNSSSYSYTVADHNNTSYHTVVIDGTNDFSKNNEKFSTSSSGYYDYFTWDANNIYFSISGADVDTEGKVSFIYIDTDPNGTNGTTSSINWNVTHTLPFKADWAFAYKVQSGDDYWNLRKYDGSSWQVDQSYTGSVFLATDYLEISIPRSDIDSPSEIKIVIFMQNDDGSSTFSAAPHDAIIDGSGSKTFAHYEGYTLDDGYTPNNDNAKDYVMRKNYAYLSFDGSNDYVKYSDDATLDRMNGATDYTIEAWIKIPKGTSGGGRIVQRYSLFLFYFNADGKRLSFGVDEDGSHWAYYHSTSNALTADGKWHHVAVIRNTAPDPNEIHLYVDGSDVTNGTYSGYALRSESSRNLYIGQDGGGGHYFKGYIDEVRLLNKALSPSDLHHDTTDNAYMSDDNTAGLFHFDEGSGTSTVNVPSGTNASLNNGVAWVTGVSALPLPVELTSFTANVSGSSVRLNWQTATEVNNYGFQVQRKKANGKSNWEKVGFVEGAGNSNSPKSYTFTDVVNSAGKYSYRLKQIDVDGSFKYSDVVEVTVATPNKFELSQNYPNPFNPTTTIKYSVVGNSVPVKLAVYDVLGRLVKTLVNKNQGAGNYEVRFNANNLPSGIYFYKLAACNFNSVRKMILIK